MTEHLLRECAKFIIHSDLIFLNWRSLCKISIGNSRTGIIPLYQDGDSSILQSSSVMSKLCSWFNDLMVGNLSHSRRLCRDILIHNIMYITLVLQLPLLKLYMIDWIVYFPLNILQHYAIFWMCLMLSLKLM